MAIAVDSGIADTMGSKASRENVPDVTYQDYMYGEIFPSTIDRTCHWTSGFDYLFKVTIIGDGDTGKTCLSRQFIEGDFITPYINTIGVDFGFRVVQLDGSRVKIQIWDTAGDPRYRSLTPACFKSTDGVVVVYSAVKKETFDNVPYWMNQVKKHHRLATSDLKVFLIGNKCDLADEREVDYRTAKKYASERQIPFMEVSAKDGTNVELAFMRLIVAIRDSQ